MCVGANGISGRKGLAYHLLEGYRYSYMPEKKQAYEDRLGIHYFTGAAS